MHVSVLPHQRAHLSTIVSSPLMLSHRRLVRISWFRMVMDKHRSDFEKSVWQQSSIQSNQMNWLSIIDLYLATVTYLLLAHQDLPRTKNVRIYEYCVCAYWSCCSQDFCIYPGPEFLLGLRQKIKQKVLYTLKTSELNNRTLLPLKIPNWDTSWWLVQVFSWVALACCHSFLPHSLMVQSAESL